MNCSLTLVFTLSLSDADGDAFVDVAMFDILDFVQTSETNAPTIYILIHTCYKRKRCIFQAGRGCAQPVNPNRSISHKRSASGASLRSMYSHTGSQSQAMYRCKPAQRSHARTGRSVQPLVRQQTGQCVTTKASDRLGLK